MSDEEIDEMFSKVDVDNSGAIDYSEFVVASMNEKNLLSNNKLQSAFKMFDKDGGGSISTEEIKQVLSFGQNLEESVVNEIIKQVDANGDGEISFDEFAEMMLKNIQWRLRIYITTYNYRTRNGPSPAIAKGWNWHIPTISNHHFLQVAGLHI